MHTLWFTGITHGRLPMTYRLVMQAKTLARKYHESNGEGLDAYGPGKQVHPMAEGKYLSSIAHLYKLRIISEKTMWAYTAASLDRLEKTRIELPQGWAWGLGFSYRGLSDKEPFLITTALIAEGLADLCEVCPENNRAIFLQEKTAAALNYWFKNLVFRDENGGAMFPLYSPATSPRILNAAVYAWGVIERFKKERSIQTELPGSEQMRCLQEHFLGLRYEGIGWRYSPQHPEIDLVHQGYIINAMAEHVSPDLVEQWLKDLVSIFQTLEGWADVCVLRETAAPASTKEISIMREVRGRNIEIKRKPARLWSLGELLISLSYGLSSSTLGPAWRKEAFRVAELILQKFRLNTIEAQYPRHAMHALAGISALLTTMVGLKKG